jgi:hypothetical protein
MSHEKLTSSPHYHPSQQLQKLMQAENFMLEITLITRAGFERIWPSNLGSSRKRAKDKNPTTSACWQIRSCHHWKTCRGRRRRKRGGKRSPRPGCRPLALFLATTCVETSSTATSRNLAGIPISWKTKHVFKVHYHLNHRLAIILWAGLVAHLMSLLQLDALWWRRGFSSSGTRRCVNE